MTIVRGVRTLASPCCGAQYAFPRYVSMNFSAFEFWTDGWREFSLMPNDEGLRRCKCGQFVLIKDMVVIEKSEASDADEDESNDLPFMDRVSDELLPECIAKASSVDMEVAARLGYWRYLITLTEIDTVSTEMQKKPLPRRHGKKPIQIEEPGGTSSFVESHRITDARRTVHSLFRPLSQRMSNFKTCSVSAKFYLTGGKPLARGMSLIWSIFIGSKADSTRLN